MTDRPMPFIAPMVRAVIEGRKTNTRRVLRPQPYVVHLASEELEDHELRGWECIEQPDGRFAVVRRMPYTPGDRLWVREAYWQIGHWEPAGSERTSHGRQKWRFIPDDHEISFDAPASYRGSRNPVSPGTPTWHKRLGRFMPRTCSRLTLLVDAVRVERLNDISEADAIAEGIGRFTADEMPDAVLWDEINGAGSWAANPWVVAVTFRAVHANIDAISAEAA